MALNKQQKQLVMKGLRRNAITRALLNYEHLLEYGDEMHVSTMKGFADGGYVKQRILIGMEGDGFREKEEIIVKTLIRELNNE